MDSQSQIDFAQKTSLLDQYDRLADEFEPWDIAARVRKAVLDCGFPLFDPSVYVSGSSSDPTKGVPYPRNYSIYTEFLSTAAHMMYERDISSSVNDILLNDQSEPDEESYGIASRYSKSVYRILRKGHDPGVKLGMPVLDDFLSIKEKNLIVMTGDPSSGKSEFIDQIMLMLSIRHGWKFAIFSPENRQIDDHISKLVVKIMGHSGIYPGESTRVEEAIRHISDHFFFLSHLSDTNIDNVLDKTKNVIRKEGINMLVIDPYNSLDISEQGNTDTQAAKIILDRLRKFAHDNNIAILLMAHPSKAGSSSSLGSSDEMNLYSISGSAHFNNKADIGLVLIRNRKADSDSATTRLKVVKMRHSYLGRLGTVELNYDPSSRRFWPAPLARSGHAPLGNYLYDGF